MLFSEGDTKVILSSLMWAAGCFFKEADAASKIGAWKTAADKADFAKSCRALFLSAKAAKKITLDDAGGVTLRTALQWAAMEHAAAAQKEPAPDVANQRRHFAGECARLADLFQKPN